MEVEDLLALTMLLWETIELLSRTNRYEEIMHHYNGATMTDEPTAPAPALPPALQAMKEAAKRQLRARKEAAESETLRLTEANRKALRTALVAGLEPELAAHARTAYLADVGPHTSSYILSIALPGHRPIETAFEGTLFAGDGETPAWKRMPWVNHLAEEDFVLGVWASWRVHCWGSPPDCDYRYAGSLGAALAIAEEAELHPGEEVPF